MKPDMDVKEQRKKAHDYVDRLKDWQIPAVKGLLEIMLDPVSRSLANAQPEDEEITDEEERAVEEAREWLRHNEPIPNAVVLADLGLTEEDFERMGKTPLPDEVRESLGRDDKSS